MLRALGGDGSGAQEFAWDVYHVENFLLDAEIIREVCASLAGREVFASDDDVMTALARVAASIVNSLVLEEIQLEVNDQLVRAIRVGGSPDATDVAGQLIPSIESSVSRVVAEGEVYARENLEKKADSIQAEMEAVLESGEWTKRFPGRNVLKRFVSEHLPGIGYEPFRNLILDTMAHSERRPANMREVLDEILNA